MKYPVRIYLERYDQGDGIKWDARISRFHYMGSSSKCSSMKEAVKMAVHDVREKRVRTVIRNQVKEYEDNLVAREIQRRWGSQ